MGLSKVLTQPHLWERPSSMASGPTLDCLATHRLGDGCLLDLGTSIRNGGVEGSADFQTQEGTAGD